MQLPLTLLTHFRRQDTKSSTFRWGSELDADAAAEGAVGGHHDYLPVSRGHGDVSLGQQVPEIGHGFHSVETWNGLANHQVEVGIQAEKRLAIFILPRNSHAVDPLVASGELGSQDGNPGR